MGNSSVYLRKTQTICQAESVWQFCCILVQLVLFHVLELQYCLKFYTMHLEMQQLTAITVQILSEKGINLPISYHRLINSVLFCVISILIILQWPKKTGHKDFEMSGRNSSCDWKQIQAEPSTQGPRLREPWRKPAFGVRG